MPRRLLLPLVLLAGAAVVGCGRPQPYHIGVVLGNDGFAGARMAADEVNAAGGIRGHPLVLDSVSGRFGTSAAEAIEAAEQLAGDGAVLAVVGHANSNATLAASQVYNDRHVVQLAPTSSTPLYSDAGPYSFRLVASDLHQGAFLAAQVLRQQPRPRVAMLYVNDDYGRALHGTLLGKLRAGGLTPVYDAPYSEDGPFADAGVIVDALAAARPGLLLWVGRAERFGILHDSLAAALPRLAVLASDGFGGLEVLSDRQHRFDGVTYVRIVDFTKPDSALRRFAASYEERMHLPPTDQAVLAHDAVALLAEAIRRAGPHRAAIRDWLARVGRPDAGFTGLSGPVVFTPQGDRAPSYHLVRVGRAAGAE
jgi:branched-chain amino acid transport system substrate-binding protein